MLFEHTLIGKPWKIMIPSMLCVYLMWKMWECVSDKPRVLCMCVYGIVNGSMVGSGDENAGMAKV